MNMIAVDRDAREGDVKRAEATGTVHRWRSQLHAEIEKHGK